MSVVFVNLVALMEDGVQGVMDCWKFKGLGTFGVIGLWYAFGDFLEMLSMGGLSGGVYQILLQSKLIITAIMMKQIKGTSQSDLQWHVLIATTLGMSAFVITDSGGDDGGLSFPLFPITMVFFKVAVSCYAAVISDAKLKGFSDMSMSAKLSQMSLARVFSSIVIATFMEPQASPSFKTDV